MKKLNFKYLILPVIVSIFGVLAAVGVVTDQAWFDRNVRDIIKTVYSDDLATGTYNYMKIKPEINRAIQTQDWRKCRLHKIANISGLFCCT